MTVSRNERGAALLTVLLLVAVMATIAATALDRIGVGTRLTANAGAIGRAHGWLTTAELLAVTRIEDLLARDAAQVTLAGGWLGVERSIALPDGASVTARVSDGGNCFNLNSLAERRNDGQLIARPAAARQFVALMMLLGIAEGDAARIAGAATDYIDSDGGVSPWGAEDGAHQNGGLSANVMMADTSEVRAVAGVSERHYRLLSPWLCALPEAELSPINVNTLLPEQAPLLAMLAPGRIDVARARAAIASRPAAGFGSVVRFWASPALAGVQPEESAAQQIKVRTAYFGVESRVEGEGTTLSERILIDARTTPAHIVRREFGEAA